MIDPGLQPVIAELDARIRRLEQLPDAGLRDEMLAILQLIDRLHRPGIRAMYEALEAASAMGGGAAGDFRAAATGGGGAGGGAASIDAAGGGAGDDDAREHGASARDTMADPAVRVLMDLYDLVPQVARERVEDVLAIVRPYVEVYGCNVDVLNVREGVVLLALGGSCAEDDATGEELLRQVRAALEEGYPSFRELVVHTGEPAAKRTWIDLPMAGERGSGASMGGASPVGAPPASIPNADARATGKTPAVDATHENPPVGAKRTPNAPAFRSLTRVERLPRDRAALVGGPGGSLLLARAGDAVHAYGPVCAACDLSLDAAPIEGAKLICPWCSAAYDVGSGRRIGDGGGAAQHLEVLPVTVRDGEVLLAAGVTRRNGPQEPS